MLFSAVAMHIPDGFLSIVVLVVCWVISLTVIGVALRRLNRLDSDRNDSLMGVLAAAIFAGQMLNFSVTGGTSGHLLGAALATILVGPYAAVLVMTIVVSTQALLFQDGGLLALGANLFNMAVVGVFVAYAVNRLVRRLLGETRLAIFISGFAAAWSSIFVASLACALELAFSGTSPANIAVPAMGGIHALIGLGEGLITLGALAFIYAARRDLLKLGQAQPNGSRAVLIGGTLLAVGLTVFSPWASSHPDGLEWVAEEHGFLGAARDSLYSIIPDYVMPGIQNEALATIVAGVVGVLVVLGLTLGLAYVRRNIRRHAS
ncbi:MAG: energy-coupling factor ABC transporter permease [Anaerolinea sp.]|nr:energy-coupling factor ABC transporter permease [Anaerolinea sp.]